jgi:guanine nucleotide-binding protein subunit alpha
MEESLALFRVILSSDYFCNASVILFLNKTDLFPERLSNKPLRYTYPDYEGKLIIDLTHRKYSVDMIFRWR